MSTAVETLKGDKEWSDSERETGMAQLWGTEISTTAKRRNREQELLSHMTCQGTVKNLDNQTMRLYKLLRWDLECQQMRLEHAQKTGTHLKFQNKRDQEKAWHPKDSVTYTLNKGEQWRNVMYFKTKFIYALQKKQIWKNFLQNWSYPTSWEERKGLLIYICETLMMILDYLGISVSLHLSIAQIGAMIINILFICFNIYIPTWIVFSSGHSYSYSHDQVQCL